MRIGTVAKKSGVSAKAIRYYESIGLIKPASRSDNGYRSYGENDVQTLRFIRVTRNLGFSIEDVSSLLSLWRDKHRASADVKALAQKHIQDVDEQIARLHSVQKILKNLTDCCHGDDRPDCPILDGFAERAGISADLNQANDDNKN